MLWRGGSGALKEQTAPERSPTTEMKRICSDLGDTTPGAFLVHMDRLDGSKKESTPVRELDLLDEGVYDSLMSNGATSSTSSTDERIEARRATPALAVMV